MGAGKHGLLNWLAIPCTKQQQEKQMKKNNETSFTEKLKQYGFEKKPKTEDGLQMWELDPSKLKKKEDKKNA
jgi:hypothetical protein